MDMIIHDNVAETFVPGNLLWLIVVMDSIRYLERYRDILVHKWLLAAQFVITNRPGLFLSWPSIINFQQDGKEVIELKSEVCQKVA